MDKRINAHHLHQLPRPSVLPKRHGISTTPFKDFLKAETQHKPELKISKHAEKRLQDRGIFIDENKWAQISVKIEEAKAKGVNDSLVILKEAALVVSAKNNIVITALDRNEAKVQIFTNINGTIIID